MFTIRDSTITGLEYLVSLEGDIITLPSGEDIESIGTITVLDKSERQGGNIAFVLQERINGEIRVRSVEEDVPDPNVKEMDNLLYFCQQIFETRYKLMS